MAQRSLLQPPDPVDYALTALLVGASPALAERIADALEPTGIVVRRAPAPSEDPVPPDAVIASLDPETSAGLAELRSLTDRFAGSKVMVVAPKIRPAGVRRAVDAGAASVLPVDGELDVRLPCAVRAACAGQICVPRALGRHVPRPALSYRERQVLGLVVVGSSNNDIARQLHLAESTVKSHLSSAFVKLGARTRTEAAATVSDTDGGLGRGIIAISAPPTDASPVARG